LTQCSIYIRARKHIEMKTQSSFLTLSYRFIPLTLFTHSQRNNAASEDTSHLHTGQHPTSFPPSRTRCGLSHVEPSGCAVHSASA